MKIPIDLFLKGIGEKKIYYFKSKKISSDEPHYFICIRRASDFLIMSCCTTKKDTILRFLERKKLSYRTLVYVKPGIENGLTEDTYINCNSYYTFTIGEFHSMYKNDLIELKGEISDTYYGQIVVGLHESTLVDDET